MKFLNKDEDGKFIVLTIPIEKNPSYGTGAAKGCFAIIKESSELEYYDEYPLVIVTDTSNNDFIRGLNLHYLPHKYRAIFFSNLMLLTTNKQMNEMTRIMEERLLEIERHEGEHH